MLHLLRFLVWSVIVAGVVDVLSGTVVLVGMFDGAFCVLVYFASNRLAAAVVALQSGPIA